MRFFRLRRRVRSGSKPYPLVHDRRLGYGEIASYTRRTHVVGWKKGQEEASKEEKER